MRFSYAITSLFVACAVAAPAPLPLPEPAPEPQLPNLANLGGALQALTSLLTPQTVNDIGSLVTNGAALLTPQFVNQTQSLISVANGALPILSQILGGLLAKPSTPPQPPQGAPPAPANPAAPPPGSSFTS